MPGDTTMAEHSGRSLERINIDKVDTEFGDNMGKHSGGWCPSGEDCDRSTAQPGQRSEAMETVHCKCRFVSHIRITTVKKDRYFCIILISIS